MCGMMREFQSAIGIDGGQNSPRVNLRANPRRTTAGNRLSHRMSSASSSNAIHR